MTTPAPESARPAEDQPDGAPLHGGPPDGGRQGLAEVAGATGPRAAALGPVAAGAVLLVSGAVLFAQAISAAGESGIELGGPTLAPVIVTGLWVVMASLYLVGQVRARAAAPAERPRWGTPFLVLALLVGYAFVLKYTVVGYVLATALFFFGTARVLSTRPLREVVVRDLAVAVGLPLVVYLVFTRLLGIALPAGVLPL